MGYFDVARASPATGATSRATSTRAPGCSTSAAARPGSPTTSSDYTGVDGSPERSRRRARAAGTCSSATVEEPLPFEDAAFDGVVLKDVLEHVADPVARRARGAAGAPPGGQGVRLLARRPALGLGRLHAPPAVHAQGVPAAVRRPGLDVEHVGYESVMPGTGIVSGWSGRHRRPPLLVAAAWLPVVRRNVWLLARRP